MTTIAASDKMCANAGVDPASVQRWEHFVPRPRTDDAHEIHRLVMSGFPPGLPSPARQHAGVLWSALPGTDLLIVRSRIRPTAGAWNGADGGLVPFPLSADNVYRFTASINPTMRRSSPKTAEGAGGDRGGPIKRKHGRLETCAPAQWLCSHGEKGGFDVSRTGLTELSSRVMRGAGKNITVLISAMTGLLVATDLTKLATAWGDGIGRGKAYGAGLLILEPA